MKTIQILGLLCLSCLCPGQALFRGQNVSAAAGNTFTHLTDGAPATGGTAGGPAATTAPFDTTGAKLFVCVVSGSSSGPDPVVTDSASNTYTKRAKFGPDGNNGAVWVFDAISPSNSSMMVVSASTSNYSWVGCSAFGDAGTPSYDTNTGTNNAASSTSAQTGALTASNPNSLYIAGVACSTLPYPTAINSPFTLTGTSGNSGAGYSVGAGYYIQPGSATSQNPTFTFNAAINSALVLASYKP